jgi:hypothetical protein
VKTKVALPETEMVNFPSLSVTVPLEVPFSVTVTPGKASPSDFTVPLTVRVCAKRSGVHNSNMTTAEAIVSFTDRTILFIKEC